MKTKIKEAGFVSLKGTKDGLLITLGEGEWQTLMTDLELQLSRPGAAAFFRGARVQVDRGGRPLSEQERADLALRLAEHGMELGPALQPRRLREPSPWDELIQGMEERELPDGMLGALMIRRTLRSGQLVQHPGNVVVFGDVNDGAEIIAGGDVLVWGKLRGLVHAGATGDNQAVVGALVLRPPQVRIGGHIARAPEGSRGGGPGPEMATVRGGQIIIEPWQV